MKILHINTERTWRGGEQQTLNLIKGLNNHHVTSHLICQPHSPLAEKAQAAEVTCFPVDMHGELDLKACYNIRSAIKRHDYDILHSHTSHAQTLAFLASLGTQTYRLTTRRVDFSIFRRSFLHLNRVKYRMMADSYIAISHLIKDVMVRDGIPAERIEVVHSGIDPQRFAKPSPGDLKSEFAIQGHEKVVINAAHLAEHKGQRFLLRSIPLVLKQMPEVRFFIIGGGDLMNELQNLAAQLGVKDRVVLTGFRPDIEEFYHLADLFVMSSVEEGLGTAILDAAAMGLPVVATTAGGIPEIIENGVTGRLVSPADPEQLAAAIVDALMHPETSRRMAAKGQKKIQSEFTNKAMVAGNIAVYRKILQIN